MYTLKNVLQAGVKSVSSDTTELQEGPQARPLNYLFVAEFRWKFQSVTIRIKATGAALLRYVKFTVMVMQRT